MPVRDNPLRRWPIIALLVVGWVGLACDPSGQQQLQQWRVSPEAMEMGEGADELFQSVGFGRILPDGRVVVADAGLLVIRIYGPDGSREIEMGRSGAGPGEFRSIQGLWPMSDGRIGAWDAGNRRVTIFDAEGRLITTHRVGAEGRVPGNLEVFFGSFRNDDLLLASLRFGDRQHADQVVPDRWTLARFGIGGELRGLLGEIPGLWRMRRGPIPFSPVPRVVVRADSLWVADPYEPRITVRDGSGAAARTIELTRMGRFAGDVEGARDALQAELRQRENSLYLDLLEQAPPTTRFPAVAGLLVNDETGHVWVKAYDPSVDRVWLKGNAMQPGPGGEWQVVGASGEPVASIRIPDELTLLDVRGGRLLAIARDARDVERVVLIEIENHRDR